ncbi:hypothetical protein LEP1GSC194_0162 [Leptospira alstonii serovar Sichuan str. 79601]|uniref:Uncharacterized protein n=1 Tax=Leptospira alstonii serovar Sichuan str. 79601 TaxID=1218565 RepID=M6D6G4_9LEPT|nr:hypothetical protein LEP1GSC194_0162 [Leptospira alstonii serovar Sichuan str. 79601]
MVIRYRNATVQKENSYKNDFYQVPHSSSDLSTILFPFFGKAKNVFKGMRAVNLTPIH